MKLGILTDGLPGDLEQMLDMVCNWRYQSLELATGNWSEAPHLDLEGLLASKERRQDYLRAIKERDLGICALNCAGNQLAPGARGQRHADVVSKTFQLAELLESDKVVMMSGLPGGGPRDEYANWVVSSWPEENLEMLAYQWETALEYWSGAVRRAAAHGIKRIALENHGCQLVYSCETLARLRGEVGEMVGMNLDPSHAFWMGGDPIEMLRDLGDAVYHIHAKDLRMERRMMGPNTLMDAKHISQCAQRSWNFAAVGYGHDLAWWKEFFIVASMMGYDGDVCLELEDVTMEVSEVLEKSTQILQLALPKRRPVA